MKMTNIIWYRKQQWRKTYVVKSGSSFAIAKRLASCVNDIGLSEQTIKAEFSCHSRFETIETSMLIGSTRRNKYKVLHQLWRRLPLRYVGFSKTSMLDSIKLKPVKIHKMKIWTFLEQHIFRLHKKLQNILTIFLTTINVFVSNGYDQAAQLQNMTCSQRKSWTEKSIDFNKFSINLYFTSLE